ncbi:HAMP domain-containing histidine kinase [Clostridium botulinum]|uniref:ATP-binding protein n=1 Tax=Clostridium botulinum TaxID=1491 RepID=UPI001A920D0C|nr:sensor histidine kinase [Clostridium botulinum]MBO0523581.1 HAMP domain-containing histidine kinase [Clostridium botulinum]MBO0529240.1 HAMP domain-containing histidine kinase [Clostridium botulinum]MBO0532780.1 HAMP domain-containing histidine kinase [Clostridium botulinum]MBO0534085.1 HAMP domain-containing histidine kinase [Clostridium botulinum]MBO0540044.1 HAMP domain-containing histidine kinase [Clostridium botulinum]
MKLFIKDNKGYIATYFISIFITLGYLALLGSVQIGECLYILLFNTFILGCFLFFRYYKNKEVCGFLDRGLKNLDESFLDLGNSVLGEGISNILKKEHNLYETEIIKYNKVHNDHLTFINQWVHQMKTPLSVIQLQMEEYEGEEPVESMKVEISKLNRGLNMAMYFARLDSFKQDFIVEKFSLYNLVRSKVNEEKQIFIKNRILPKVEIDDSIEVHSDFKWMKFVLEQLIVNGVKYSKDKGKELIIRAYDDENSVKLSIIDKGVGIPKKDIKRVFEPFFTGENGRNFGESTGMGLHIVKRICDNLDHDIFIESKVSEGTTVSIVFKK